MSDTLVILIGGLWGNSDRGPIDQLANFLTSQDWGGKTFEMRLAMWDQIDDLKNIAEELFTYKKSCIIGMSHGGAMAVHLCEGKFGDVPPIDTLIVADGIPIVSDGWEFALPLVCPSSVKRCINFYGGKDLFPRGKAMAGDNVANAFLQDVHHADMFKCEAVQQGAKHSIDLLLAA